MSTEYFSSIAGSSNSASSTVNNSNSNNACTSTRWLTEEVFGLIDLVQRNEAIYNPRHKYYFCRPYVENFWREVDLKLEKNPGASLAKWTNLRISFRREYTNYLEEKVPPCWTYFDRMFFLHPYLRKKHQQSKSLDSQVQDALVQISSLSNRLQRERAVAAAASAAANSINPPSNTASPTQPQLDHYLEYFDDPEPNASELDDMIDDEPSNPQHFAHSTLANDIKSECEDNVDEYDNVERPLDEDEHEHEVDDADMRNFVLNSLEKRQQQQQHHQRLQHLQRLQSRAFYEDFRNKRSRSHDNISSSQSSSSSLMASSTNHTNNVSFVRPTFAKPLEVVSTTTQSHNNTNNNSSSNNSNNSNSSPNSSAITNDNEPVSNSTPRLNSSANNQHHTSSSSHYTASMSHSHTHHQHQRFEISAINSSAPNATLNPLAPQTSSGSTASSSSLLPPAPATPELCDCKTDPDAMFLMSLLPDIQKLNGRDRGKIKIAFQNILQDYLYPD
ncbi:GATA zinc finger domain-containing protein 15 [Calliphora vicina]|uniref:GATA zinc finger domain-containing protein 15 n=1 Tax=Calliphora vicina TaxID=7373 RepID=UPI00325BC753